ncbi:FMN-dependent NADH-azoreductase [Terriglobus sp. 2YAB30_2]|uniref:FMN-dependent NADH-azoreductase n=1 Tax=unclassified Terriglobus TaxID=2628988 RepID=UPI003F9AF280
MSTLLKVDVSSRGNLSISRRLSSLFLEQWREAHADCVVIERDIATTNLPFLEFPWIAANLTRSSARTEEQKALLVPSDELIAELQKADEYVIATPMYNFGIPAKLKAYVDHIVRSGLTFTMNADGSYTGLLSGKKATVIIASAGEYGPDVPAEGLDTLKPYLREILGFIGVTDVTFIQSGSTWKVDSGSQQAEEHIAPLIAAVKLAAGG